MSWRQRCARFQPAAAASLRVKCYDPRPENTPYRGFRWESSKGFVYAIYARDPGFASIFTLVPEWT